MNKLILQVLERAEEKGLYKLNEIEKAELETIALKEKEKKKAET